MHNAPTDVWRGTDHSLPLAVIQGDVDQDIRHEAYFTSKHWVCSVKIHQGEWNHRTCHVMKPDYQSNTIEQQNEPTRSGYQVELPKKKARDSLRSVKVKTKEERRDRNDKLKVAQRENIT